MNLKLIVLVSSFGLLFVGCSQKQTIDIDTTPKMQIPKKVAPSIQRKGALYSRKGASLFSDKKDLQIGDIIQINIDEGLANDSSDSRDIKKATTSVLGGGLFTSTAPGTVTPAKALNNIAGLGFNGESQRTFKGSASSSNSESFNTTISAIIEQTYQNGNYFVSGSKVMLINGQKQTIGISGVIRPYDITPENIVNSDQLANLKILYDKAGEEGNSMKKPWGTKIIETIWPF